VKISSKSLVTQCIDSILTYIGYVGNVLADISQWKTNIDHRINVNVLNTKS